MFKEDETQYCKNCYELQQQLDQLKAENDTYKKMLEDEEVILALTEVRTGERHLWYSNAQKLEQALTEIKEIAEKQYHTKLVDKDCINCDESFAQILQKYEVLDE